MDPFTSVSCLRFFTSSGQFQSAPLPFNLSTRVRVIYRISNTTLLFLTHAIHDSHPSTVPWLEPNGRWEHPCGRGDGGLSRHLYLHALQCPGFHGMVPSRSPGAKGTFTVTVHLKVHPGGSKFFFLTCFGCLILGRTLPNSQWFLEGSTGRRLGENSSSLVRQRETRFPTSHGGR